MSASRIARTVTRDLDLWPPLTAADVRAIAALDVSTLARYDEDRQPVIESRILQETDHG